MNALPASSRFTETPAVRRKLRQEALAKWIFCAMAAAMVVPLLLIVGYLVVRAAPSLNLEFLLEVPNRGMTEGGIWPALILNAGLTCRLAIYRCWPASAAAGAQRGCWSPAPHPKRPTPAHRATTPPAAGAGCWASRM